MLLIGLGRGGCAVPRRPNGAFVEAAGAQRVDGAEHVGPLHRDAQRAVAAHRVAGQPTARARGQRPVVAVHVAHQVVGDIALPVAGGDRVRVHAAAVGVHAVRHHQDHFSRQPRTEHTLRDDVELAAGRPEVAEVRAGVAVQQVDDRIAPVGFLRIARRQVDRDLGRRRLLHQVAFKRLAVHLDALERAFEHDRRRRGGGQHWPAGLGGGRRWPRATGREGERDVRERTIHGGSSAVGDVRMQSTARPRRARGLSATGSSGRPRGRRPRRSQPPCRGSRARSGAAPGRHTLEVSRPAIADGLIPQHDLHRECLPAGRRELVSHAIPVPVKSGSSRAAPYTPISARRWSCRSPAAAADCPSGTAWRSAGRWWAFPCDRRGWARRSGPGRCW